MDLKIKRLNPSLQIAMRDWILKETPLTGKSLTDRILMPSGYMMTLDEVSYHMACAALAVFSQASSSAGLNGD